MFTLQSPPSSWSVPRQSHPSSSNIHQTLISKALYEHGKYKTVAAVAASSSSLQNSSLGPNLLALIEIDSAALTFFSAVFNLLPTATTSTTTRPSTLQFTHTLRSTVDHYELSTLAQKLLLPLLQFPKTSYLTRSLQHLEIDTALPQFFVKFLREGVYSAVWTKVTSLSVFICESEENNFEDIVECIPLHFPSLTKLTLNRWEVIEDEHLKTLLLSSSKKSSEDDEEEDEDADSQIRFDPRNLVELSLFGCASLSDEGIIVAVCKNCPNLTSLNLGRVFSVSDESVKQICKCLPKLKYLNLRNCMGVTAIGLSLIGSNLPFLEELNVSFCEEMTMTIIDDVESNDDDGDDDTTTPPLHNLPFSQQFPRLCKLDLEYCELIDDDSLKAISKYEYLVKNLQELHISYLVNVTDVGLGYLSSKLINLRSLCFGGGTEGVTESGLIQNLTSSTCVFKNSLEKLDLTFCHGMTGKSFQAICNNLPNLTCLKVANCFWICGLTMMMTNNDSNVDGCQEEEDISKPQQQQNLNMKHLDLAKCDKMTDDDIKWIVKKFPRLKHLDISNCSKISDQVGLKVIAENLHSTLEELIYCRFDPNNRSLNRQRDMEGGVSKAMAPYKIYFRQHKCNRFGEWF